ncbi:hypothetical protein C8N47_10182 [Mangrovibacterium marinum]|uniref:Uncharacterized protein n=1 Tax=Mangrovibacterium marinum TaxID=1639118 RepID=A0A2T5C647_9BACT|nr:hypothetical protein C8N47_10182 [Mangrovibacterium marinum]
MIKNLIVHKALIRNGHYLMLRTPDLCPLVFRDQGDGKILASQQHWLSLVAMRTTKGLLLKARSHSDFSISRLFR